MTYNDMMWPAESIRNMSSGTTTVKKQVKKICPVAVFAVHISQNYSKDEMK
jgi:hypothetical protein